MESSYVELDFERKGRSKEKLGCRQQSFKLQRSFACIGPRKGNVEGCVTEQRHLRSPAI
jgi:hypothetical protein